MKLGAVPENVVERLVFLFGVLPPGIVESWFGIMVARTMMAATKLDIFEALAGGALTAEEVAGHCNTHTRATTQLQMGALFDLFFGVTSEAGTWSVAEVADWLRHAGLEVQKPRHPWVMPDLALHLARKPL